jgi:hypothetical protein
MLKTILLTLNFALSTVEVLVNHLKFKVAAPFLDILDSIYLIYYVYKKHTVVVPTLKNV